ncbi:MAG: hypothetical protein ACFBSE_19890 [Prochloraceae cyanobacterium]
MLNSSFDRNYSPIDLSRRKLEKVPFLELYNGRLQGVVSSGSDLARVYVSYFEAGSLDYYCSTNNNRPCGGLRGQPCKHLQALLKEAIASIGIYEVSNFLELKGDPSQFKTAEDLILRSGSLKKEAASVVFSRFLNYLRYLELQSSNRSLPGMSWFV